MLKVVIEFLERPYLQDGPRILLQLTHEVQDTANAVALARRASSENSVVWTQPHFIVFRDDDGRQLWVGLRAVDHVGRHKETRLLTRVHQCRRKSIVKKSGEVNSSKTQLPEALALASVDRRRLNPCVLGSPSKRLLKVFFCTRRIAAINLRFFSFESDLHEELYPMSASTESRA